ncbi:hypothetical protein LTR36_005681 [Oleoguttula mirabilis]|uniref:Uncharacterized protein n=1 Tax=Oleoguttula mirabilis TaxID=1507867 RepID=A0AAV9JDS7_9PEZI|nr:hypothetical protein LTR36_005681 [Oleoguttula mirabilis]
MHLLAFTLLTSLTIFASADFLMSNTSICIEAFPLSNWYKGPVVITGTSNVTDFICAKLKHAEDYSYITNGTAGPHGDSVLRSDNVCGNGILKFVSYYDADNGGNATYYADATHVADCKQVEQSEFVSALWAVAWNSVFYEHVQLHKHDRLHLNGRRPPATIH